MIWLAMVGMASAQTHVVKKPETVVRAVGVYEYTGEDARPTASRFVPVSIFINSQLEDAGLYLARPVPFALGRGTLFEVAKAGVAAGTLELNFQRRIDGPDSAPYDDGWQGLGTYKPIKEPAVVAAPRKSGPLPQVIAAGGSRPKFANKDDQPAAEAKTVHDPDKPAPDKPAPDKPAPDKPAPDKPAPDTGSNPGNVTETREDSAKPTMQRRTPPPEDTTADSADDGVDRPTLKRRTPQETKDTKKKGETASVRSASDLNDDQDRPTLHRGTPVGEGVSPLNGLPADMKQMVAVSDARDREPHDFTRAWESATERAEVLGKLQQIARARLAGYDVPGPVTVAVKVAVTAAKSAVRRKKPQAVPAPALPPVPLGDEALRGFTLSYGGAATYVYTATSPGLGGVTRYVSVVAQQEAPGELKAALTSVTDSAHLDRTPWLRLVDVVDAEASNRASLLFELRAEHARQFALYRVIGARAEQVFETGTAP